ncbi:Nucleolar pre-ribosomal-associated protein 1 [Armadillidium nasatum]|uniref:Nucleolar pre-ribosomal-associated protein 1 n=1 Tax=Armadillidium nasatum TaxID=96803 RepID=A0A5N5SY15_9CRUS|nr:Nucleolar pre-ribosomal-associated protein 1 [Armadillidium nasatum]
MNPKELIQQLENCNSLQALELFINEFESNNGSVEILTDLLIETPNFDKILNLLEQEQWTCEEHSVIYNALGSFLISLSADEKYENVGLHVTRFILQKYNKHLITLLKPSNEKKYVVAGLKMITSMVVSSLPAATEVIKSLSFHRIEFSKFANKEPEIRINFLYMILALLSTEDDACVAQFVNSNSGLITSVFEKLLDDPFEVVVKFLKLLRNVVLNSNISKTTKIKLFNEKTCKFLTIFYFYQSEKETELPFTAEERNKLRMTLHSFMISLCSDLKHGIIFKDADHKMNSGKHRNMLVYKILKTIQYPWQLEEGRELIVRILKACPDILGLFMEFTSNYFIPRENYGFSSLIKLCIMFIEDKEPWEYVDSRFGNDLHNKNIIFTPFLNKRKISSMIKSNSLILTHLGLLLLNTCMKKAKEIQDFISRKPHIDEDNKKRFQNIIFQSVENLGYNTSKIFLLWYEIVKQEYEILPWFKEECPSKYILLLDMSEFLHRYVELFGYNIVRLKFNPLKMLQTESNFPTDDLNVKYKIVANLLKILILAQKENHFEAFGFSLNKMEQEEDVKIDENFFSCLVNLYSDDSLASSDCNDSLKTEIKKLCFQLLKTSVDNWGLSEYCQNYVEIWLNNINSKNQSDCSKFFAKVVSQTISSFFSYLDIMTNLSAELEDAKSYSQINILDYVSQMDPSIEIGDNEDINPRSIVIPFSCLILGAVDVLKEDNNDNILYYFMNVVEDYIHRIDTPSVLSTYLLERNILIGDTKNYLCYLVNKQPVSTAIFSEDLSSHFKLIFISESSPQKLKSPLLDSLENSIHDCIQIDNLCRQVFSYIQSEFKSFQNDNDKRKLKYFLKIFKKLIHLTQKEPFNYLQLFEYLINHSFTIHNYQPFSSFTLLYKDIENLILQIVLEKYPELHRFVEPFMEKLISHLNISVEDERLATSLSVYFKNYTNLCYNDIEKIILSLLKRNADSFTESFINIISEILKLLKYFSSLHYKPSENVTVEIIKKMIYLARHLKSSKMDFKFLNLLSDYVLDIFTPEIASNFVYDDLKNILKSRIFNEIFNKILLHSSPDIRSKLLENVNNMKIHLSCQVPFVMSFINENSEYNSIVNSYLMKIRSHLIQCALNSDDNDFANYQHAIEYMLSKDMFELSDIVTVCRRFYNTNDELPRHILSLKPFFDYVLKKQEIIDDNDDTPQVDLPSHSHVLKEDLNVSGNGSKLMDVLIHLIPIIYSKKKEDGILPLRLLYQMLRSHSQFISLMLDLNVTKLKEQIALLQLTIVQLHSDVCEERHVPILLGAYGASRSLCDQYILKILYLYEKEGFMPTYEPTLWGRTAVSHFAVEQSSETSINIRYQAPRVKQVLSLIDYDKVIETAIDFDMTLGLEPVDIVEQSNIALYDQRFLLSMFLHFSHVEHHLGVMEFVEKGFVALGIAALSSHRNEVWKAGATVLQYIVSMFEKSKYENLKIQWMWLVVVMGYGLEGKMQRVPSIITHFVIRASQILLCPQNVLYKPVTTYLYLKSALPINKIPELNRLLFSTDFQYNKDHRAFLLELLSSGIRDELDVQLVNSALLPKLLLSSIKSPSTNSRLRVQGMKVLRSMKSLPKSLTPYLNCPTDKQWIWIDLAIDIVTSVFLSLKGNKFNSNNDTFEPKSGSKRKHDESNEEEINGKKQSWKKRKLTNGHVSGNEHVTNINVTKCKKKNEVELFQLISCLGSMFNKIMCEGKIKTLIKTLDLMKEIEIYLENQEVNSPLIITRSGFIKNQFKKWIANTKPEFQRRFQTYFHDDDAVYFGLKQVSDDWKFKPISSFTNSSKNDLEGLKDLISRLKDLSNVLENNT